jgi:hypothetical protein
LFELFAFMEGHRSEESHGRFTVVTESEMTLFLGGFALFGQFTTTNGGAAFKFAGCGRLCEQNRFLLCFFGRDGCRRGELRGGDATIIMRGDDRRQRRQFRGEGYFAGGLPGCATGELRDRCRCLSRVRTGGFFDGPYVGDDGEALRGEAGYREIDHAELLAKLTYVRSLLRFHAHIVSNVCSFVKKKNEKIFPLRIHHLICHKHA